MGTGSSAAVCAWRPLLGLLLLLLPTGRSAGTDGVYDDMEVTRIAFGSCSKQYKNQTLWDPIMAFRPEAFLWTGDVIYVKDGSMATLRKAYEVQLQQPGYRQLMDSGIVIEGVYDDHDYGENDAGASAYHRGRQDAYLDFLGHVPATSPRRERHGLYSSHTFGKPPHQVRVIFLDTRSSRAPPALNIPVPNWVPLKPFVLAALRWVSVALQQTKGYAGDMLGEEQWAWLEDQLKTSEASIHLLISTVQVLSVNPIVEGWGHFPESQKRLLALLDQYSPKGLVLLSGDVHFAELLATQPATEDGPKGVAEVTSSGMTHTCTQTALGACKVALALYNRHRVTPESVFAGLNFGTVEVEWDPEPEMLARFSVRVRNVHGKVVLEANKTVPSSDAVELGKAYDMSENQDTWAIFSALALLFWSTLAWLGCVEQSNKNKAAAAKEAEEARRKQDKKKK